MEKLQYITLITLKKSAVSELSNYTRRSGCSFATDN
jgi:hypothetical protein